MTTKDLLAQHATVETGIGKEGLGHWGQQGYQRSGLLLLLRLGRELGQIQLLAHIAGKCPSTFGHGLHAQQHASHIGVDDNRVGNLLRCHGSGRGTTLQALAGIGAGILVGGLGAANALDADRQTLVVHHGKHRGQALVGFTDQPSLCAVKVDHAGCRSLDPHLVLDGAAAHRIALSE